ncbi:MAG TPA: hypothetical protein DCM54_00025 [Gammaproteobacteria bacterium]|nr:hypothetical protein [Gammaproteobacteria bacterium]
MLELGVIADDLTGGMMVASLLEQEGVRCPLVTSVEALANLDKDAEAVVIGRKIRLAPPEDAVAEVRRIGEALLAKETRRLYYKYSALFMSTDQGNIGPASEVLVELTGADHVLFCTRWAGCTVYMGRAFVNSAMLHESGASRDPATPMTNSNLVEVLQAQSKVKVGSLPFRVIRGEKSQAEQYLREQINEGTSFFIADGIDDIPDVENVARLSVDTPLSAGADGLPIYLARAWQQGNRKSEPSTLLPPAPGYAAVLAASCSGKTNRQLKLFEEKYPLYRVDLLEAAKAPDMIDEIVSWASGKLEAGPVGISTTMDADGVERVQAVLGRQGAADLAEDILGKVTKRLHEIGVRKFVVAGGETSGKVIDTLGINQLQVSAFDTLGGGYCHAAGSDPVSLVTKAGGQGQENFFEEALERMRAADAQGNK